MRQMLMDLHADIKELLVVDYDQSSGEVICEAAWLADTIVKPQPRAKRDRVMDQPTQSLALATNTRLMQPGRLGTFRASHSHPLQVRRQHLFRHPAHFGHERSDHGRADVLPR